MAEYDVTLTMKLCNVYAELVALLEHAFTTLSNEVVESMGEPCHALAQVVEAKIDVW